MDKIKVRKDTEFIFGHWKIDGEYYKETTKCGKLILKHVNKEKLEKRIEMADKIANKLKNNLDAHKVLLEAICKLEIYDMKKLYNLLFKSERSYIPITRSHHCVDMRVGNFIIPIVE